MLTDLENEFIVARGEAWGKGIVKRVWDRYAHTAVFKIDNQGPTVQHPELCSMLGGSIGWEKFGGE